MKLHIVTYATHSGGTFKKMMKDAKKYKMSIEVLGWGQKWKNYFCKLEAIDRHIKKLPVDDLVVVIDAFDTRIKGTTRDILKCWDEQFNKAQLIFASSPKMLLLPNFVSSYFYHRCFGGILNAGLYMGRVGSLVALYEHAFKYRGVCNNDDQCAFNKLAIPHSIVLDNNNYLFNNIEYKERCKHHSEHSGVFCSYPGTWSLTRIKRVPYEYGPIFWKELCVVTYLVIHLMAKKGLLTRPYSTSHIMKRFSGPEINFYSR